MTKQRTCKELGLHEWIRPRTKTSYAQLNQIGCNRDDLKMLAIRLKCVKCDAEIALSGYWKEAIEVEKETDAHYTGDLDRVYYH